METKSAPSHVVVTTPIVEGHIPIVYKGLLVLVAIEPTNNGDIDGKLPNPSTVAG